MDAENSPPFQTAPAQPWNLGGLFNVPARSKGACRSVLCCVLSSQLAEPRSVVLPGPTSTRYDPDRSTPRIFCLAMMVYCSTIATTTSVSSGMTAQLSKVVAAATHTPCPQAVAVTSLTRAPTGFDTR